MIRPHHAAPVNAGLLLGMALWLTACPATGDRCTSTTDCADLQACIQGVCEPVDCLANADCALENRCDPQTFTCEPGCGTSDDCPIGERCDIDQGVCVQRQCRDTQLDCGLGERCDATTGECIVDPEPHCQVCRSDAACGANGYCTASGQGSIGYCFLECSPEAFDPCPAGLQCSAQLGVDGELDAFRCVGFCGDI